MLCYSSFRGGDVGQKTRYPSVLQQILLFIAYTEGQIDIETGIEKAYLIERKHGPDKKWQFYDCAEVKAARASTRRALTTLERKGFLNYRPIRGYYMLTDNGKEFCDRIKGKLKWTYSTKHTKRSLY